MSTERSSEEGAQALLAALLESTSDFIMIADGEGRPVAFNRAYVEVIKQALGVEPQVGVKPHEQLSDPEGIAFWDELHRRVLGGERFAVEVAQEFPEAGRRHFSFSFNPTFDGDRVTGFCEISREITDRVRAEEALRESERTLRESQEVAQIGSYVFDIATGRWRSSSILDEVFGIDADCDRTFDGWVRLLHPDFRASMRGYFEDEVIGKRRPFDREYMIVRANDGAERWVRGHGRLELDAEGAPLRMIGTVHDITERKMLELRIRQQEKMEAVGQLAGGIAHDFNNQLVGILGFADLLRAKLSDNAKLAHYAESIVLGAKRAADLTSQLLAFSRKGKQLSIPVDLHRIIVEVVGVLHHTIDKRIAIKQRLAARPATTLGDPSQLQSAVLNLALNARDAMPRGGEILFETDVVDLGGAECCGVPAQPESGQYVRVRVRDTGTGIDREIVPRIFEPFFTTKAQGSGTGMGLAAVYGTAKSHGGCIAVDSEEGRGTTFTLCFPLAAQATSDIVDPIPRPAVASPAAHILLVDDEATVRNAAVAMLVSLGYNVTTCSNGAEAVDLYRDRSAEIDLVILDMMMPVLDGRDTYAALREINTDVRLLAASGYSLNDDIQGLQETGARGFLHKPFTVATLASAIEAALREP